MIENRERHARTRARETAVACLEAGIRAALPETAVDEHVEYDAAGERLRVGGRRYDLSETANVVLLGGGKGAGRFSSAIEAEFAGRIDRGVVVCTDPGSVNDESALTAHEGDHPTPSEANVEATGAVREVARTAGADDAVVVALTGGASALWCDPVENCTLRDVRRTTESLLESGANVHEVNAVRTRLSAIKGGRLTEEIAPAEYCTLAISDVVGDDPAVIGSGPTVRADPTRTEALDVLDRYDLASEIPETVVERLRADEGTTDDRQPSTVGKTESYHVLANGHTAIDAARTEARSRGYGGVVLAGDLEGEAREAGRFHAAIAREIVERDEPIESPAVVVSGGEMTVTVTGNGAGGPNQEFALGATLRLPETARAALASVDTDGIDGPTDACGAIVDGETVCGPDAVRAARRALGDNDALPFLARKGALLRTVTETGYTGTNVNDLRVLVVEEA